MFLRTASLRYVSKLSGVCCKRKFTCPNTNAKQRENHLACSVPPVYSARTSAPPPTPTPPLGVRFLSITSAIARLPPIKSGWEVLMYASSNCSRKR